MASKLNIPYGPRSPALLQAVSYYHNPYRFLSRCQQQYGDIFTINLPGFGQTVVINQPQHVKSVFTAESSLLDAGTVGQIYFAVTFGMRSLVTLDGKQHLYHRKLMLPAVRSQALQSYLPQFANSTMDYLVQCPHTTTAHHLFHDISLNIIFKVIFGFDEKSQTDKLRRTLQQLINLGHGYTRSMLTGLNPRFVYLQPKAMRKLTLQVYTLLHEHIRHERQASTNNDTVINRLINARDEEGRGLSNSAIADELITLLMTGHETTALTCTWALYHLLQHPQVLEKLLQALATTNNYLDLLELNYLDAIIQESMRLTPILPIIGRRTLKPFMLEDYCLPIGMVIAPSIYLSAHAKQAWEQPEAFIPERFLVGSAISPYQFYPFGGGHRRCLGSSFAMHELKLMLGLLLKHYHVALKPGYMAKVRRIGVTFGPAGGVPIKIKT